MCKKQAAIDRYYNPYEEAPANSHTHVDWSSGDLGAYEISPSQKGCDHKKLLPPSSHHCLDHSLPAHSCPTALHPLPLLIVLQSHERGGKPPKLGHVDIHKNYPLVNVQLFRPSPDCYSSYFHYGLTSQAAWYKVSFRLDQQWFINSLLGEHWQVTDFKIRARLICLKQAVTYCLINAW